jgi:predicted HAD superfamily Cof-like phosphohydrolase
MEHVRFAWIAEQQLDAVKYDRRRNSMENKYYNQVKDFHLAFEHPVSKIPARLSEVRKYSRIKWMQEELNEYKDSNTLFDDVDALIDLAYFVFGSLVEHGVEPDNIFTIVHNANMGKIFPDGKVHKNTDGKTLKPPFWQAPEPYIMAEIKRQTVVALQNL